MTEEILNKGPINNTAWSKQKLSQEAPLPTIENIKDMAYNINSLRNRCLFILTYLTAGRVTEIVQSIARKDITKEVINDRVVILIRMPNRKHKTRKFKDIPIPVDKEKELLSMALEYINTIEHEEKLFNITRIRAYQILMKEVDFNVHYIRHIRATHLVVYHDFNEQFLVQFMGWSDSRPAKHYMELKWKDILQKY